MLKNYLLVAFRNFQRQKLFSFINVVGLAIGLTCSLLIYLWVSDEINKDKFHADLNRIHRVVTNIHDDSGTITWMVTPGPLAEEIKASIPEVEYVTPVSETGKALIQAGEKSFLPAGYFATPDFFKIFTYKLLEGNALQPLPDAASIVITKSLAEKLFGTAHALGKVVTLLNENELTVTGIAEDVRSNSSLQFDFIAHFDVYKKYRPQNWNNSDYPLYLKLREGATAAITQKKINDQVAKTLKLTDYEQKRFQYFVQPFGDRYLYGTFENGFPTGGKIKYVKIFTVVAIFILIVACINFMNLATARASVRHKEIGVRKVIGAQRRVLIIQFITESLLTVTLSMILAIFLVELLLPIFNLIMEKHLSIQFTDPAFYGPVLIILFVTGILAGIYPAFVLSGVSPVSVLKSKHQSLGKGISLRQVLVVFQFTLSVVLIVSSIVAVKQISFIQNKQLGYNKENILIISARGIKDNEVFKNQLLQLRGVRNVSVSGENITHVQNQTSEFTWKGKPEDKKPYIRSVVVGYDFPETIGLKFNEGRSFSKAHNDTANFIINKKLATLMNVAEPIGTEVEMWGVKGEIVGVVEDFHLRSLSEDIDPVALLCYPEWTGLFYVNMDGANTPETMARIEETYKVVNPHYPFEYTFLDDSYHKLYREEQVISKLSFSFTGIAIIISTLGLLGLASYATERKKKEISIRKVLGASIRNLLFLLSGEFLVLVMIAIAVGLPLGYLVVERFLEGYAYHISIDASIFLVSAAALLVITLAVISFQVMRAALENPVDNLRNE
jgi:putative ABC transport system permease protein